MQHIIKYNTKKKFGEGKQSSVGEQKRGIVIHLREPSFPYIFLHLLNSQTVNEDLI